jgi:hypothetical protein
LKLTLLDIYAIDMNSENKVEGKEIKDEEV